MADLTGMLQAASGLGLAGLSLSLTDERAIGSTNSTFTFSSVDFGSNTVNKSVLVFFAASSTAAANSPSITDISIGGTSVSSIALQYGTNRDATLVAAIASVSSTSGTVSITFGKSLTECIIAVYELINLSSLTPSDSDTDQGATPLVGSVTRPSGPCAVLYAAMSRDTNDVVTFTETNTNATEDGENSVNSAMYMSYGSAVVEASGTENFSIAFNGGSTTTPSAIFLAMA